MLYADSSASFSLAQESLLLEAPMMDARGIARALEDAGFVLLARKIRLALANYHDERAR
jgi:hypothetical protein